MAFPLPRLQRFCFCLSLRAGCLLLGYISMVFSMIALSAISYSLYRVVRFVETHENSPDPDHTKEDYERITLSLYISHGYLLFVYLYYMMINVLLVIIVHLNKVTFMKYYIYGGWLLLVMASATVVISTVLLHFMATIALLKWCFMIFFSIILVRSLSLEIEDQNKPRELEMQNLYIPQRAPQLLC